MEYVSMHEVAYDANSIVFPGLGHCHGVVYQTNVGLFAMHIFGGADKTPNKAMFFGDFVTHHRLGATATGVCLYGVCPTIRFQGQGASAAQKAELQVCAAALKFNGRIEGAMWDLSQLGWGTTYVECNLVGNGVQVRIEDFTSQPSAMGGNASPLDHKIVRVTSPGGFGAPMQYGTLSPPDTVINGVTRKPATPSIIIATTVL